MSTLAEVMDAMADQLINQIQPHTSIKLHIENRAFLAAETPAIDMLVTPASGLEPALAAFNDLYGAIPITLRIRLTATDLIASEDFFLALIDDVGDLSIVQALDYDHTLGGVAQDLTWGEGFPWSGYSEFPDLDGNVAFLGSTMTVAVAKAHS